MENFVLPLCVLDSTEIAIPVPTDTSLTFQPTLPASSGSTIPANSICLLDYCSTAFVTALSKGDSSVEGDKIIGLLLTAAHCMSDIFTAELKHNHQSVSFRDDREPHAELYSISLTNFLKRNPVDSVSPSTQRKYSVSNDIELCLLLAKDDSISPGEFNEFSLGEKEFDGNGPLVIVGHPHEKSNDYCFPGCRNRRLILDTFCGFDKLVMSTGRQFRYNNELIEVKCSTTSGMSGSPCFAKVSKNADECKLAGIYVGGPPLSQQFEIVEWLRNAFEHRSKRLFLEQIEGIKKIFLMS